MRTRIYFQPASQIGNVGDLLINLATLRAVRPYGEIVINDLRTPAWFLDAIGAGTDLRASRLLRRNFHVSLALQLLRQRIAGPAIRHYLVLAPGHTARKGAREALPALTWYLKLALLRLLGCRVVRAGFSIGPFDGLNGWVESLGSRAFSFYGVRDRQSLALARRYGFSRPSYFPDLAWSYRPSPAQPVNEGSAPVVLSFRSNAFGQIHDAAYLRPILARLGTLLASPLMRDRRVVVACQVESDRAASRDVADELRRAGMDVELRGEVLTLDEAARLYAGAWCVVSNRLHVLLLALQSGALPLALADAKDNVKITSILNDNDLGDLVVSLNQTAEASLVHFESVLRERARTLARLARIRDLNAQRIEDGFARVFPPSRRRGADREVNPADSRTAGEYW